MTITQDAYPIEPDVEEGMEGVSGGTGTAGRGDLRLRSPEAGTVYQLAFPYSVVIIDGDLANHSNVLSLSFLLFSGLPTSQSYIK